MGVFSFSARFLPRWGGALRQQASADHQNKSDGNIMNTAGGSSKRPTAAAAAAPPPPASERLPSGTAAMVAAQRGLAAFLPKGLQLVVDPFGLVLAGRTGMLNRWMAEHAAALWWRTLTFETPMGSRLYFVRIRSLRSVFAGTSSSWRLSPFDMCIFVLLVHRC